MVTAKQLDPVADLEAGERPSGEPVEELYGRPIRGDLGRDTPRPVLDVFGKVAPLGQREGTACDDHLAECEQALQLRRGQRRGWRRRLIRGPTELFSGEPESASEAARHSRGLAPKAQEEPLEQEPPLHLAYSTSAGTQRSRK